MSVSNTSLIRRKVIHNRMKIDASAQAPASPKARMMVRLASRIETGPPIASGATACTARANFRSTSLLPASPLGLTEMRARPSGTSHWRRTSGGIVSSVTFWALSMARSSSSAVLSGGTNTASARDRTR